MTPGKKRCDEAVEEADALQADTFANTVQFTQIKEVIMKDSSTDKAEGTKDKVAGKVKETVGKVTGNEETEAEGKGQNIKGHAEETKGNVKNTIDKATK
jgi:uncharacterized protein YjbJ (UPF0337 family)